MNFRLSAAAVSGGAGARRWVDDGPGSCVLILLFPPGPRLSHGWLATLLSEGCHQPRRALGEYDGPTINCVPVTHRLSGFMDSTSKCLQSVTALGFALR